MNITPTSGSGSRIAVTVVDENNVVVQVNRDHGVALTVVPQPRTTLTIDRGVAGASGYSGYSGFSGISGAGYSGASGYSGKSGFSGYSGFSGFSGSGVSGYSGYSGLGLSGYSGYSGAQGTSGYSGFSGTPGASGYSGISGFSGYSGSGISGYSGYSGVSGAGYSGYSGYSGQNGASGVSGYSGYSGYSGSGISGYSGYSGSGISGYSGYSGFGISGYSGYSGYSGSGISGYSGYSGAVGASGYSGYSGYSGAAGLGGTVGAYGSFYDTTTQTAAAINTAYAMTYNTTVESTDVLIVSGSRITFSKAGTYNVQFSAQLDRTNTGTDTVNIWLRLNGTDVVESGGSIGMDGGAAASRRVPSWNYVLSLNANDYLELMWSVTDTHIRLLSAPASAPNPAIPSVILTATQVMYTQSGYSGTSGYSGFSGISGWSGISGYSGSGISGYSGYSGSGLSGYSGYSGSGISGYSGFSGAVGTSGYSGYSGYSGSGISGYSGWSGISGYSGSGVSGYSGYSGSGISGWSGYSGSGISGYSGYSGYSGSGISGYSGYSGSGISGYSGFSGYSGMATGYPGAGIVTSTGSAWGSSLTAPSGAIVGTTDTQTLTNKRVTPRVSTTTSSATPTINTDNVDLYGLTAQAADITSFTTNLSGTPTDGQKLWIYIVGTAARAITWGASFEASTTALPTTTVTTNRLDVGFVWNAATSKWRCMASA